MHNFVKIILEKYYHEFKEETYKKDSIIYNEGSICKELTIVISGEICISTITYNEAEETINVIKEYDVFGDILCNSTNNIYLGDVITKKKTTILIIPINKLTNLLLNDKNLLVSYLNLISSKALEIKLQAKLFSHKKIEDRIMYYLSTHATEKKIYIDSITSLSRILSLPRPSVSRSLSELERKKFIVKQDKYIYIL